MSTPPVTAPAKTTKAGVTTYILLSRTSSNDPLWRHEGAETGNSGDDAIRKHVDKHPKTDVQPAELVAIPARSWTPRKITVETVSKVSLS